MGKGEDWERELSKTLSLWWTDNARDDVVWRTHGSGSRATARSKQGKATSGGAGDLMAMDPVAEPLFTFFLIEAKRGYAKSAPSDSINVLYWLDKLPTHKPPLLLQWWWKAERERMVHQRCESLIIFRRTNKLPVVMLRMGLFRDISDYHGPFNDMAFPVISINYHLHQLTLVQMTPFLEWCAPGTITTMLQMRKGAEVVRPRRALIP